MGLEHNLVRIDSVTASLAQAQFVLAWAPQTLDRGFQ